MKRPVIYTAAWLALVLAACHPAAKNEQASRADSFRITGTIAGLDSGWAVFIHFDTAGNRVTDSAAILANTFTFTGLQREPALYYMAVSGIPQPRLAFFVENAPIKIAATHDSIAVAAVTGSPAESMYEAYKRQLQPVTAQMDTLNKQYAVAYQNKNQGLMDRLNSMYDSLDNARKEAITRFVKAHPASVISAWAIAANFLFSPRAKQLGALYHALDTAARQTSYGKKIKTSLEIAEKLAIGKPAPDFTQAGPNGRPLSLSSLKGHYVLIDFWASWCGPCRAENPNVVRAYNKYQDKGFTVLGVSLDEDKAKWLKAIKQDHLDWHQVSDLKGWKNEVARQYGIRSIPANFLVDKEGVIIAHNLRGDKLEARLATVIK